MRSVLKDWIQKKIMVKGTKVINLDGKLTFNYGQVTETDPEK